MRGEDERPVDMFGDVRPEERVPADHPLRGIRALCDAALAALDQRFAALYSRMGRPSIPPEMLLRATLLQVSYSVRSERQLMERSTTIFCFAGSLACAWMTGSGTRAPATTANGCSPARWRRSFWPRW